MEGPNTSFFGTIGKFFAASSLDSIIPTVTGDSYEAAALCNSIRANIAPLVDKLGPTTTLFNTPDGADISREEARTILINTILKLCEDDQILIGENSNPYNMTKDQKEAFRILFRRLVVALDEFHEKGNESVDLEPGKPTDDVIFCLDRDRWGDIALFDKRDTRRENPIMTVEIKRPDIYIQTVDQIVTTVTTIT